MSQKPSANIEAVNAITPRQTKHVPLTATIERKKTIREAWNTCTPQAGPTYTIWKAHSSTKKPDPKHTTRANAESELQPENKPGTQPRQQRMPELWISPKRIDGGKAPGKTPEGQRLKKTHCRKPRTKSR